jgi:uncharacterized membrane protein
VRLTYETGIAAFIQFIVVSLFILVTQLGSAVVSCVKGQNCVTNLITSIAFFILTAIAFGVVWLIGYAAQNRRSRRLTRFLICVEIGIALIALFSIKLNSHSRNVIGLIASFGMLVMAAWVISLAFRLMRAGGGRVVASNGRRRRRTTEL